MNLSEQSSKEERIEEAEAMMDEIDADRHDLDEGEFAQVSETTIVKKTDSGLTIYDINKVLEVQDKGDGQ